jgi:hypothetical protein
MLFFTSSFFLSFFFFSFFFFFLNFILCKLQIIFVFYKMPKARRIHVQLMHIMPYIVQTARWENNEHDHKKIGSPLDLAPRLFDIPYFERGQSYSHIQMIGKNHKLQASNIIHHPRGAALPH